MKIPIENQYCKGKDIYKERGFDGDLLIIIRTVEGGVYPEISGVRKLLTSNKKF